MNTHEGDESQDSLINRKISLLQLDECVESDDPVENLSVMLFPSNSQDKAPPTNRMACNCDRSRKISIESMCKTKEIDPLAEIQNNDSSKTLSTGIVESAPCKPTLHDLTKENKMQTDPLNPNSKNSRLIPVDEVKRRWRFRQIVNQQKLVAISQNDHRTGWLKRDRASPSPGEWRWFGMQIPSFAAALNIAFADCRSKCS
jgi:hypothetical protein